MNKSEIKQAKKILESRTTHCETCILDGGGQCLTAHWIGGRSTVFYSLHGIDDHLGQLAELEANRLAELEANHHAGS